MLLFSQDPRKYWLKCLVLLAIVMVCVLLFKQRDLSPYYEGFSQETHYVHKKDNEANDQFYAEIYDQLMTPDQRNTYVLDKTIEMTLPSKKHSKFLEIGSKTGSFLELLRSRGFQAEGLEASQAMIDYGQEKYPAIQQKCGLVTQPMTFDKQSFSHVICNYMSFYEIQNKYEFFQNCYFWLKQGGYVIIHLVDPQRYDPIIPGGKPPILQSPQKYSSKRITDTMIDFIDFQYKAVMDFGKWGDDKTVVKKETFSDELTKNVRQNEFVYKMETLQEVLAMAANNGFIVKGQVNMEHCTGDEHQYLVILERPQ